MKNNIKYSALSSLFLLSSVFANHLTAIQEQAIAPIQHELSKTSMDDRSISIGSISELEALVTSLDGQSVIGFDFDDTLARRHVFAGNDLVDDILFHTENTRDRREAFKSFLNRYAILPDFTPTGAAATDRALEDAYLKEGASIVRNKLLVAAAERLLSEPSQVHVPYDGQMISQTHRLMPVEGEITKNVLRLLQDKGAVMGICSVMYPARERLAFADSLGLKTYIQGHDKLTSLTDLVLKTGASAVKNLILVDNYSASGKELMAPQQYGYAHRDETLAKIKEQLAPGARLISVVYNPPKDVSKTGVGLSQAYWNALGHPAVHVPINGSGLGPNSQLAVAFAAKSKADAQRILETIGIPYGSATYPGQDVDN